MNGSSLQLRVVAAAALSPSLRHLQLASADGAPLPPTGAGVSSSKIKVMEDGVRALPAEFNGEKIVGRTWPAAENRLVVLHPTRMGLDGWMAAAIHPIFAVSPPAALRRRRGCCRR